ncbi:M1 family metallopeptidase [Nocardioides pantholopis]|uniref:M1 family metallopeptidase n=1 Tax=Nocardioides pantholopis TaxID=2483798 RepID=UPI000FD7355B|nr:M1 family metallopeptidase [Nocardioides pantholopis]
MLRLPRSARRAPVLAMLRAGLLAALPLALLAGPAPAAPSTDRSTAPSADRAGPVAGSSGIGDPYFPLDGNGGIDVRRYRIHVGYDFDTGRLTGRAVLTVRATRALARFNLDLLLPVEEVRVDGRPASFRKPRRHELQVSPARPIAAGSRFTVTVRYAGRPAGIAYAGERNWLADEREVVTMNQPHMAPWWFPANDHPSDKAQVDVSVTVPRARRVVANGELVGRRVHGALATTRWRSREPMAPYLAFFAAGPFQVDSGRTAGVSWYAAVSRQLPARQRTRSMRLMRRSAPITAWAASILGEYPFSSTGGLTTALQPGFALENQTRPTYPVLGADAVPTVVHEIAHQWFGNSVAVDAWRDIWLNEGAATFFELLWAETHGGPSAAQWLSSAYDVEPAESTFWRLRIDDPGAARIFDEAVYLRGAMTFQALRTRIGAADFATLLRTWVARGAGGTGSTAQFTALAEQVSGEDLDGFFDAWVRTPARPARTAANGL